MTWNEIRLRLALFQHNRVEDELEEEIDAREEKPQPRNRSSEVSRLTRVQFGSLDMRKEECRDARGTRLIEDALADTRYAVRSVWRGRMACSAQYPPVRTPQAKRVVLTRRSICPMIAFFPVAAQHSGSVAARSTVRCDRLGGAPSHQRRTNFDGRADSRAHDPRTQPMPATLRDFL